MQAQSIENIFANEDVMQGGTVWNAVPDYMFTKGCKSYEGLFLQFFTMFTCLKFMFAYSFVEFDKKSYPEIRYNSSDTIGDLFLSHNLSIKKLKTRKKSTSI